MFPTSGCVNPTLTIFALAARLAASGGPWVAGKVVPGDRARPTDEEITRWIHESGAAACLVVDMERTGPVASVVVRFLHPEGTRRWRGSYGGPQAYSSTWAVTAALDFVRRRLA